MSTLKGQRRSWEGQKFAATNNKNNNYNTDNNDNIKSGLSEGEIDDVSVAAVLWRSGAKTKQEAEQKSAVARGGEECAREREQEREWERDGAKSHVEYSSPNTNVFQPL